MKKIMIAAFAVAFAAVSQAATVDWKTGATSKIYAAGTTTLLSSGTAFLIDIAAHTQDQVLQAFVAGTDLATFAVTSSKSVSAGVVASGTFTWDKTGSTDCILAVIADDNIFISDTVNQMLSSVGAPSYQFKEKTYSQAEAIGAAAGGFNGAGWYTAVPEPTSGLLLLLGMAGLALKRKQA